MRATPLSATPFPAPDELATWPGVERRDPRVDDRHFLVLAPLGQALRAAISRSLAGRSELDVLDIGCGGKPYLPLFAGYARSYRGIDAVPGPVVDDVGEGETLPYEDASFDVVLCTQVLEHVEDPAATVAEVHRVLRPGGVAFLSTHGTFVYHPDPPELGRDYWRWTHQGLRRLLTVNGTWDAVTVEPNGEVIAALGYTAAQFVDESLERLGRPRLRRLAMRAFNRGVQGADRRFPPNAREGRPGSLSANYLVTAVRA